MGARAVGRSSWLVAPALLVRLLRAAFAWPALVFALGMAYAGMAAKLGDGPASPGVALRGALVALTAPRTISIAGGLWLASLLASAALRVAFLAGALPTLAEGIAALPERRPRFAEGLAFGFAPLLGTAALGFALELGAQLFGLAVLLASVLLALHPPAGWQILPAAGLGAGALVSALALLVLASLVVDAALVRTSVAGDPPATALAQAFRRVLGRPGAFALAGLVLGAGAVVLLGSLQILASMALGAGAGAPPLLLLGPRLMLGAFGALLAGVLEMWRLGTVASLACAE
jgi:hypothetical protein